MGCAGTPLHLLRVCDADFVTWTLCGKHLLLQAHKSPRNAEGTRFVGSCSSPVLHKKGCFGYALFKPDQRLIATRVASIDCNWSKSPDLRCGHCFFHANDVLDLSGSHAMSIIATTTLHNLTPTSGRGRVVWAGGHKRSLAFSVSLK